MGNLLEFKCDKCAYTIEVHGFGRDYGGITNLHTMTCHDCTELVDVVTGTTNQEVFERIHEGSPPKLGHCPDCGGKKVKPWPTRSRPCPKCGSKMPKGESLGMWDG